jgi:hypothetical protein
MSIADRDLHDAVSNWVKESLQALPGAWSNLLDVKPGTDPTSQFDLLAHVQSRVLTRLPSFEPLANIIKSKPATLGVLLEPDPRPSGIPPKNYLSRHLSIFLIEYLKRGSGTSERLVWRPSDFEDIYRQLESHLFGTEPFDSVWLVSISNLELTIDHVDLSSELRIRTPTAQELAVHRESNRKAPTAYLEYHEVIQRNTIVRSVNNAYVSGIAHWVLHALRILDQSPIFVADYSWAIIDVSTHLPRPECCRSRAGLTRG